MMNDKLDMFLYYLKNDRGYSDYTIKSYSGDINKLIAFLEKEGITSFDDVSYNMLSKFITSELKGLEASSVARAVASIKSFFGFLYRMGFVSRDVSLMLLTPRTGRNLPNFIFEEDILKMINSLEEDSFTAVRNKAIFTTLYATGMRVGELVSVDIDRVDIGNKTIRIMGKGSKERIVIFGDTLKDILIKYMYKRNEFLQKVNSNEKALFINNKGKRITDRGIRYIFKKYINRFESVYKFSPHTLRHSFATHLIANGADVMTVKRLLGHSSVDTTQVYTHITSDIVMDEYQRAHPHGDAHK